MLTRDRVFREIALEYRLASPDGGLTPTTQSKRWFFAVPPAVDNVGGWTELLHRIFWDSNTLMRLREPGDANWLALDSFTSTPVDLRKVAMWSGATDPETVKDALPWHQTRAVWEFATCWWVDDDGQYDGLDAMSFSELAAYRAHDLGVASEDELLGFIGRMWPGNEDPISEIYGHRVERIGNIEVVRVSSAPRKAPGSAPIRSGPPIG